MGYRPSISHVASGHGSRTTTLRHRSKDARACVDGIGVLRPSLRVIARTIFSIVCMRPVELRRGLAVSRRGLVGRLPRWHLHVGLSGCLRSLAPVVVILDGVQVVDCQIPSARQSILIMKNFGWPDVLRARKSSLSASHQFVDSG